MGAMMRADEEDEEVDPEEGGRNPGPNLLGPMSNSGGNQFRIPGSPKQREIETAQKHFHPDSPD